MVVNDPARCATREGCVRGDRKGLAQEPPRVHWVLQSKDVSIVKKVVLLAKDFTV